MSIVSTRPRVRSVVNARTISTARTVAQLLNQCAPTTASFTRQALKVAEAPTLVTAIHSINALLIDLQSRREEKLKTLKLNSTLSDLEARKLSLVAAAAEKPLLLEDAHALQAPLLALQSSRTVSGSLKAQEQFLRSIVSGHQRVLTNSLTIACSNAFAKIGFRSIETIPGLNHTVRLVATNERGKTLVTEIHAEPSSEPSIATEVVSGCDGETPSILDAFDNALEEEGIRSDAPIRKGTGGVCELWTAREFLRRKVRPAESKHAQFQTQSTDSKNYTVVKLDASRRTRRLNQKRLQKTR